jgi:hypothetical protein
MDMAECCIGDTSRAPPDGWHFIPNAIAGAASSPDNNHAINMMRDQSFIRAA